MFPEFNLGDYRMDQLNVNSVIDKNDPITEHRLFLTAKRVNDTDLGGFCHYFRAF